MHHVKVEWLTYEECGRKTIPSKGKYFSVARFPEDINWQNNAWSVVFELESPTHERGKSISSGTVSFLVDNAPQERMPNHFSFDIYEGPKKVANVYLRPS
ncbi:hypothetical protein [Yersinia pseudotuberculosis]|uniref:hypothetical protein n=1 Tax=Yersinia pseudotuberculosis TaxID=633 RepID=UPI0005E62717|nr:hypothetical protein [Yersinia pseudotuberculosis]CNB75174.1 Uncharacterised protein [Yersinia pseudotuberculosis]